ncbi:hypothetical protein [Mycolicibacterium sp.]|uniref:hypothetical protein n=1 Tax=Mycolicibacterium sp. TaxID=2320850 RepID=UPI0037C65203
MEKRSGPPALPRATVLSTRSVELIRSWGLADAVAADPMTPGFCCGSARLWPRHPSAPRREWVTRPGNSPR